MLNLPDFIANKIILDALLLKKKELWKNIHKDIENQPEKESIRVAVNINGTLYRYRLNKYIISDGQTFLPKLRDKNSTISQFYSSGYVSRISGIDCESLPYLDIDESDILLRYS